mgnify:CR=1 FL=1
MKNKRLIKNIIMISLIIVLIGGTYFTMYKANKSISAQESNSQSISGNNMPEMGGNNDMRTPPDMNGNSENNMTPPDNNGENSQNSDENTPPEMPNNDGNNNENNSNNNNRRRPGENGNNERPNKRQENEISENNDSNVTSMNNDENVNNDNNMTPPDMNSDGGMGNKGGNGMTPPDMNNNTSSNEKSIGTIYYVIFGLESLVISLLIMYLIMSGFNKKTFKETFTSKDKLLICILSTIILTGCLTYTEGYLTKNVLKSSNETTNNTSENSNVKVSGKTTVEKEETLSGKTIKTNASDESAVLVQNGGNLTLENATINKAGGDSSNTENSEFYGVNAGILVTKNSTATIKNTKITTNAKGSNAVFSTGEDSKIYISDSTITTTGESSSRGLDATYGGYIEGDNLTITTQGGSCATLATDRGEGTVKIKNSTLETNGSGSPVIYSTGDIQITKTKGTANGSQMVVIEGKNSATVSNSTLEASAKGNRGTTDQAGVMIYQSMSGDASEGTGTFTAKNSSLTIQKDSDYYKTAPMFFITNTDAVINLESTTLSYGSNLLISAKGTSEWGNEGSNGGNVTLNATKESLKGDIEVDKISEAVINLTNSTYEGTINKDNTAKSITLKLDKDSKITLTGDSYITSLDNADSSNSNIDFNGYKLYVNGKSIN